MVSAIEALVDPSSYSHIVLLEGNVYKDTPYKEHLVS